ncbi:prismalin-14-like [Penaeus chinensis]|uniref:prismalin-14-like n=1 Tax=Penaeus chinensis TaxID=139456 RepID=UPI001FB5BE7A|nr:prismalin-14-like [Penaeus chinensis]
MRALLVALVALAALALGTHASPGFMGMGGKGDYDYYYDEGETVIYVPVQYPVHHYSQSSSYGGAYPVMGGGGGGYGMMGGYGK